MIQVSIYGIKNCDTMKKALKWLEANGIAYDFHDYKKRGIDEGVFMQAIEMHGWEIVINKRGTTWRALPEDVKNAMDAQEALKIARENPSIIKRPILLRDGITYIGFKDAEYQKIFS